MGSVLAKIIAGLAAVVLAGVAIVAVVSGAMDGGDSSTERDSRVISSVTREEQVVLLSLGIQGILQKTDETTFLGKKIPGSSRASFLQYSFNAKLGVEGKDVRIVPVGENEFLVSVPEFIFIGHDSPEFKLVAEDNGVLSFITPEIDPIEMINSILSDEAQEEYIRGNEDILKEQVTMFYSGILTGVDPEITLRYDFSN